jgi:hypothetical protein
VSRRRGQILRYVRICTLVSCNLPNLAHSVTICCSTLQCTGDALISIPKYYLDAAKDKCLYEPLCFPEKPTPGFDEISSNFQYASYFSGYGCYRYQSRAPLRCRAACAYDTRFATNRCLMLESMAETGALHGAYLGVAEDVSVPVSKMKANAFFSYAGSNPP